LEEVMKHASSRVLYDYWNRVRGERSAPERSEMKPDAIGKILGDVLILETGSGGAYKVRLAGTQICTLLGRELRGRSFIEPFAAEEQAEIQSLLDSTTRGTTPVLASVVGETEDRRLLGLELLLLPLRHHGRTDTRLIGSLAALTKPYWSTLVPLATLKVGSSRFMRDEERVGGGMNVISRRPKAPLQLRVVQGGRA
jgi:hypothetical protein